MTDSTTARITGGLLYEIVGQYWVELEQLNYGRATISVYRRSITRLRTLPRPDRRHRLRASRYSRRRLYVRLSARARPRGGRSATPACPGGQTGTSHALLFATGTSLRRCP